MTEEELNDRIENLTDELDELSIERDELKREVEERDARIAELTKALETVKADTVYAIERVL